MKKRMNQREIKWLVSIGSAKSADNLPTDKMDNLRPIDIVGVSRGKYGANGLLFTGSDGILYAVTARNSALFYFL